MQWANNSETEQGDTKRLYDGNSGKWCLAVADKNYVGGYELVAVGTYEEVKKREQLLLGNDRGILGNIEKFERAESGSERNKLRATDGGNVVGSIRKNKSEKFRPDTKGNNDDLHRSNKETSTIKKPYGDLTP